MGLRESFDKAWAANEAHTMRHREERQSRKAARNSVAVRNYTSARDMERDMGKMLGDGWHVEHQTGQFDTNLVKGLHLKNKKITVTYTRQAP